jgi:hypothetical protein
MKRRIAALLSTLLWALFAYIGYDAILGVARQHAPGYPNAGQWHYYVHFPLIMLFYSVGILFLAKRLPTGVFVALWVLQIVVFIPFFLGYTGGM